MKLSVYAEAELEAIRTALVIALKSEDPQAWVLAVRASKKRLDLIDDSETIANPQQR
jgi:hypothetical protein